VEDERETPVSGAGRRGARSSSGARHFRRGLVEQRLGAGALALGTVSSTGACTEDDLDPPVVVAAEFVDAQTLVVQFSEPIASIADVNPAAHFRLGTAMVIDYAGDLSVYYDLAHHFSDGLPGTAPLRPDPGFRHAFTNVARIERGESSDELRLTLTAPVERYVCDALVEAEGLDIPAAIHLHYSQGSFPRITDESGNPLPDMGAWWVSSFLSETHPGFLPLLDPRISIPCPDDAV